MTILTVVGPPVPDLPNRLRLWAKGYLPVLTAVELLIAHERWLTRSDFVNACVDAFEGYDYIDGLAPMACVRWEQIPQFLRHASGTYSPGMSRVLRLAAEVAGTGSPPDELPFSLDDSDTALVFHAVAHAAGWNDSLQDPARGRSTHIRRLRRHIPC
jgi:hypothetical protein